MFRIQEPARHRDTVRNKAEHPNREWYRVPVQDQAVSPDVPSTGTSITPIIPIVIVPVLIGTTITGFLPERI